MKALYTIAITRILIAAFPFTVEEIDKVAYGVAWTCGTLMVIAAVWIVKNLIIK